MGVVDRLFGASIMDPLRTAKQALQDAKRMGMGGQYKGDGKESERAAAAVEKAREAERLIARTLRNANSVVGDRRRAADRAKGQVSLAEKGKRSADRAVRELESQLRRTSDPGTAKRLQGQLTRARLEAGRAENLVNSHKRAYQQASAEHNSAKAQYQTLERSYSNEARVTVREVAAAARTAAARAARGRK